MAPAMQTRSHGHTPEPMAVSSGEDELDELFEGKDVSQRILRVTMSNDLEENDHENEDVVWKLRILNPFRMSLLFLSKHGQIA
tara:strand:- start:459 stop:707 length:249 start_codon:yes stop_codon:yes gene_type:complete